MASANVSAPGASRAGGPERDRPGRGGGPPAATRRRRRLRPPRGALPYLLLAPAIVAELVVHIVPIAVGVWMSFKELTLFYIREWSRAPGKGLGNYRVAVDLDGAIGADLLRSFLVTLAVTLLAVGLSWLLGTAAAVLMQDRFRGRGPLRAIFLVPYALPVYTAVMTWAFMFQRDNGMINHVLADQLGVTGGDRPFWLIGDNSFWALVTVIVWRSWPFAFLVLMAGLQNIPRDLYEASALDGAGMWRQIRHITLPALRPINQVLVLVLFLWTFNDFNTPFVLFGRAAPAGGDLISVHIYHASFVTWNFGTGSAMSVLLLLFLLLVTASYLIVTSRRRPAHG
ncbi:sugar ABC transporter permease [Actinomadura madurae]|uniref:Carbohydrate ABC transporter membrane protein 1, CUT1 family n=1 Tax=Actinomadura madurae TaxID=1993 RepID=A0A1I5HJP7_9ACTN|nr:sugar ABC transporter permease [Actinomadura madurae]SFO48071.1 carbohydrate ABC transporter membrane protein 1, CUT1 family [Actinomadura madurae]SPT57775.1 Inner membrane ABC transporter permease protein ycjO [Actinomadura madurae]